MKTERIISGVNSVALRLYLAPEANRANNLVVSGFPKSGTTWITQLLAKILNLSYAQNRVRFAFRGAALHTHSLNFCGKTNVVYIIRDPREVVCSIYRSLLARGQGYQRNFDTSPYIDAEFCRFALKNFPGSRMPWDIHVSKALEKEWEVVYFEDLKTRPIEVLQNLKILRDRQIDHIIEALQVFDYSRLCSKDTKGSFLNGSGIDTWKSYLTQEAKDYMYGEFKCILDQIKRYT